MCTRFASQLWSVNLITPDTEASFDMKFLPLSNQLLNTVHNITSSHFHLTVSGQLVFTVSNKSMEDVRMKRALCHDTLSGIQGTGLMGAQLSTIPQDAEVPLDGQETPTSAEPGKVGFRNPQRV